jgi:hypothetical protein
VMFWPDLAWKAVEAMALAWLFMTQAWQNPSPGPRPWLRAFYGLAWPGPRLLLYNLNSARLTSIFSPSPPCPITLTPPLVLHLVTLTL